MIVLDASALIALVNDEAGADIIGQAATEDDATISTVNYSEALPGRLPWQACQGKAVGAADLCPKPRCAANEEVGKGIERAQPSLARSAGSAGKSVSDIPGRPTTHWFPCARLGLCEAS